MAKLLFGRDPLNSDPQIYDPKKIYPRLDSFGIRPFVVGHDGSVTFGSSLLVDSTIAGKQNRFLACCCILGLIESNSAHTRRVDFGIHKV